MPKTCQTMIKKFTHQFIFLKVNNIYNAFDVNHFTQYTNIISAICSKRRDFSAIY